MNITGNDELGFKPDVYDPDAAVLAGLKKPFSFRTAPILEDEAAGEKAIRAIGRAVKMILNGSRIVKRAFVWCFLKLLGSDEEKEARFFVNKCKPSY